MPRPIQLHKLTVDAIRALPPAERTTLVSDGGGLNVQVNPSGGLSWLFRYRHAGRERSMGLGVVELDRLTASLAEARGKAAEARALLGQGLDPLERRRAQTPAQTPGADITFRDCADAYLAAHEPSWRNPKHRQQWRNTLNRYVHPTVGALSVAAIDVSHVKTILQPIWRTKPETASRVAGRIKLVLDYATAHRYRSGENPARPEIVRQLLGSNAVKVKSHAAVPWQAMPEMWAKLAPRTDVPSMALRFLILTATRSAEARAAAWHEIEFQRRHWVLPPERMKGDEIHRIPLSTAATEILTTQAFRALKGYVFPGPKGKPISDTSLKNVMAATGGKGATLHGFRSTFRDWCADNGVPDRVAEAALAHKIPGKVEAAYLRTRFFEARKVLMQNWADFLSTGVRPGASTHPEN